MPTTVRQIFQRAYATSRLNEPGRIAEEQGEMLAVLNELLADYMANGARLNRRIFTSAVDVVFAAGAWARPVDAEMIQTALAGAAMTNVQLDPLAVGSELTIVPFDQLFTEPGRPALYELGGQFYSRGTAVDPAGVGTVRFVTPVTPATLDDLDDELPDVWPSPAGDPCLKWELAIWLAQKDGERDNEVAAFSAQRDRAQARYGAFLKTATIGEVASYGRPFLAADPGVK